MACPRCKSTSTMCISSSEYYDEYKCTDCGNIYLVKK